MRQVILFVFALVVSVVVALPSIKNDWVQVNVLNGSDEGSTYVYPHAAAFSDGSAIIVYTIQTQDSAARVMGKILAPDGSVAVAEFDVEPDVSSINVFAAPKVVVFDDDTFLVAYRWDSGDPASIQARRFDSDGTLLSVSSFRIDIGGVIANPQGIELVAFKDYSYAVLYYSTDGCTFAVVNDPNDNFVGSICIFAPASTEVFLNPFAISNSDRSAAFIGSETDDVSIAIGRMNELATGDTFSVGPVDDVVNALNIAVALSGNRALSLLYTVGSNLTYATVSTETFNFRQGLLARGDSYTDYSSPAILGLNASSVLMAYKFKNFTENTEYLLYQTAHLVDFESSFGFEPVNTVLPISTKLHAFHLTPLTGSDILVVAKDTETYAIKRQIITFCGNGQIELNEDCDGSANCDSNCRCMNGLIGYNGVCGLPNVIPVLDCVEQVQGGNTLYFSFINEDRVAHSIGQGETNSFSPAEYGGARPTEFSIGSTLTYPVSPFTVTLPTTETQVNWLLGSYNLTVDLTNVTPFLCPDSPGFIVDIALTDYLNDVALLAANFAQRYELSEYRLSTSVEQTAGDFPAKKRVIYKDRYDVTVTVAPANASSPSQELTSAEAVKAVVQDFKNSTTQGEVTSDLLNNYDDAIIKDITPAPTGVEVRGNRYDSSNAGPPQAQPSSPGPSSSPSPTPSSTVPQSVSGSAVLAPGALGLFFIIGAMH